MRSLCDVTVWKSAIRLRNTKESLSHLQYTLHINGINSATYDSMTWYLFTFLDAYSDWLSIVMSYYIQIIPSIHSWYYNTKDTVSISWLILAFFNVYTILLCLLIRPVPCLHMIPCFPNLSMSYPHCVHCWIYDIISWPNSILINVRTHAYA